MASLIVDEREADFSVINLPLSHTHVYFLDHWKRTKTKPRFAAIEVLGGNMGWST